MKSKFIICKETEKSVKLLGAMTLGITTFGITTLCKIIKKHKTQYKWNKRLATTDKEFCYQGNSSLWCHDAQHNDTQHNDIELKGLKCDTTGVTLSITLLWKYAEHHYAECCILFIIMLNVIMMCAIIQYVMGVVMLNVFMLSVVNQSAVAPSWWVCQVGGRDVLLAIVGFHICVSPFLFLLK